MINSKISLILLLALGIFNFSCSDGDDLAPAEDERRLPMSDVPDQYFEWSIDGVEYIADTEYQSAYNTSFGNEIIVGGATNHTALGDFVFVRINNDNPEVVKAGDSYVMDGYTADEITIQFPDGGKWSTANPGGSGSCEVSLMQEFHDVLFTIEYIEGTFSATLTSLEESEVITIENGTFGMAVWR